MLKKVSNKFAIDWFVDKALSLPVLVLSYDKKNKRPNGMVAGWNMPCSSDDLRICIALWNKGYSHKLVRETKEFVVAIPNEDLLDVVKIFGSKHGDKVDKFKLLNVNILKSKYLKVPLLKDATANYECKVEHEYKAGDHFIFVGKVLASHINTDKQILVNLGKRKKNREYKQY